MIRVIFGVHLIWLLVFSLALAKKPKHSVRSRKGKALCDTVHKVLPTKFYLRTHDHFNLSSATANQEDNIFENHLKPDKDVAVIVHEYLAGCDKEFVVEATKAFHKTRPEVQVVNVCWNAGLTRLKSRLGAPLGTLGYIPAVQYLPCVGDYVAKFLKRIHQESHVPWNRITLVAHSLGTQISGDAGNKLGGRKIKKIIALDPAVPLYGVDGITASLLGPKSAKQVIVLHTSQGQYNMGTADFYANTATQPGCEKYSVYTQFTEAFTCSHTRSFKYFIESVLNPHAFPARKCASYDKLKEGKCARRYSTYFGPETGVTGTYFFKTLSKKPYYRMEEESSVEM
uniref:Putative phospholipase A1 magnifin n=1 Tax=Lygus hesperus TaxID=30085 RepID=A0A0A9WBU3_LYGHE